METDSPENECDYNSHTATISADLIEQAVSFSLEKQRTLRLNFSQRNMCFEDDDDGNDDDEE